MDVYAAGDIQAVDVHAAGDIRAVTARLREQRKAYKGIRGGK